MFTPFSHYHLWQSAHLESTIWHIGSNRSVFSVMKPSHSNHIDNFPIFSDWVVHLPMLDKEAGNSSEGQWILKMPVNHALADPCIDFFSTESKSRFWGSKGIESYTEAILVKDMLKEGLLAVQWQSRIPLLNRARNLFIPCTVSVMSSTKHLPWLWSF